MICRIVFFSLAIFMSAGCVIRERGDYTVWIGGDYSVNCSHLDPESRIAYDCYYDSYYDGGGYFAEEYHMSDEDSWAK